MNTLATIVPNDLWVHTHFQLQGNHLVLTGYVVNGTKFKIFDLKLDLKRVLAMVISLHRKLHAGSLVSGDDEYEIGDEVGRRSRRRRRQARRKARRARRSGRRRGIFKRVARKISRSRVLRPVAKKVLSVAKRVPGLNAGTLAVETAVRVAKGQKPGLAFKKALGRRLPARSMRRVLGNVKKRGLKGALLNEGKRLLKSRVRMASAYIERYAGKSMPASVKKELKALKVKIPPNTWKKLALKFKSSKQKSSLKKLGKRVLRFGKNKLRRTAVKAVRSISRQKTMGSLGRVLPVRDQTLKSIAAAKKHLGLVPQEKPTKFQKYAKKLAMRERSRLIRIARQKKLHRRYSKTKLARSIQAMTKKNVAIKLRRILAKAPALNAQLRSAGISRNEAIKKLLARARHDPKAFKAKAVLKSILLHAARVNQIEKNRNERGVTGVVVDSKGKLYRGRFIRVNTGKGEPNAIYTQAGVQSGFFERVGIGGESCVGCGPVAGEPPIGGNCVGCEPCVGVGCEPCVGCGPAYPLGPVLVR